MAGKVDLSEESLDKVLKEKFTNPQRPSYCNVRGAFFPISYERVFDEVENFEVKEDDIWVCTFPKCGTTWSQEMVWCIGNDLDFEGAKVHLGERFPFLELEGLFVMRPGADPKNKDIFVNTIQRCKELPSPRYIKTHLPFQLLPKQIRTGEKKPRIIYVTRNPKDACISYYHHAKLLETYRGNLEEYCRLFLGNKITYTPYWDHIIDYWKRKDEYNMLFYTYEEMKADLNSVMRRVAKYLGKTNITDEQFKILERHLSFESMKNNEAVNLSVEIERMRTVGANVVGNHFIRKGEVNQWKEDLSPELIAEFDKRTKEKFGPLNITVG